MPSLATTLKVEIRRLAARETRKAFRALRRVRKQLRNLHQVHRAQRKGLAALERRLARFKTRVTPGATQPRGASGVPGRPLTPASIYKLRTRLGLSRLRFAKLLGVSSGSIFGWEKGRTVPRGASRARIAEVRKLGLRAARSRAGSARGDQAGPAAGRKPAARRRTRRSRRA